MWWSYLKDYDRASVNKATDQVVVKQFKKFAPTLGEFKELLEEVKQSQPFAQPVAQRICDVCRSFTFTQHHHDVCITGKKSAFRRDRRANRGGQEDVWQTKMRKASNARSRAPETASSGD